MDPRDISAVIIAGGQSRRFGGDKSLFNYQGKPLIEHVINAVRPVISRITIAGDDAGKFSHLGLDSYPDSIPGMGPIGGVYTALRRAISERIFVFACDMPGLNRDLIRYMAALSKKFDITVPVIGGWYEPLHAVYSKACLIPLEKSIQSGNRQIIRFFEDAAVRKVTEEEIRTFTDPQTVFRNINYRSDAENQ